MKIIENALLRSWAARFHQIAFLSIKVLKIVIHTGLKFSSKRQNSALFIKIVQNTLFRSFLGVNLLKVVTLVSNSLQNGKTVRFQGKLYKTLFSGHAQHVFAKIAFVCVKVVKIVTLAWNSLQNGKTVRLPWKFYKTLFSGHAQHVLAKIAFVSVKVVKSVTLASYYLQKGKTVRFSWKLYKTLFSGHAQHVLAKSHFWASMFSKWSNWPEIVLKTEKQCTFHENCTKRSFQVMRSTFWSNRIFEHIKVLKIVKLAWNRPQRKNSKLSVKIAQNALFRSCAVRFAQIEFLRVKVVKIVTLAWNSL